MAGSRRALGWILILALAGALLYALNPTLDDFVAWRVAQAQGSAVSQDSKGVARVLKQGAETIAGAIAGTMVGLASGAFVRTNYYLFSTFSTGPKGQLYLGVARVFIKLR
jgi:hypothetical protein